MSPPDLAARLIALRREYDRLLREWDAAHDGKGGNAPTDDPAGGT